MPLKGAAEWNRLKAIEAVCRDAVTRQADKLCWMDLYTGLAELLAVPFDPKIQGVARMLDNCKHFVQCLADGGAYQPDREALEAYRELMPRLRLMTPTGKIKHLTRFMQDHVPRLLGIEGETP
jgi:hypothetical protein